MRTLHLGTFNCFGTAQNAAAFIRWRGMPDAHRLKHPTVHEEMAELDIVCLQEIYISEAEEFFAALAHPHKVRDENRWMLRPLSFGGSGLAVASRLPLSDVRVVPYPPIALHAERFARKGLLFARAARTDARPSLAIINTHLQSGYSAEAIAIRERQIGYLRDFIDANMGRDEACLVVGDLNVNGIRLAESTYEYRRLAATLFDFEDLGRAGDQVTYHPHPEHNALAHRFEPRSPAQRVDYIWFRQPTGGTAAAIETTLMLNKPLAAGREGPSTFASDHYGLRTALRFGESTPD